MVASSKGNDGTSWSGAATAPAAPATVPAPASAPAAPAVPDALRKLLRLIRSGMGPLLGPWVDDEGAAAAPADRLGGRLEQAVAEEGDAGGGADLRGQRRGRRGGAELLPQGLEGGRLRAGQKGRLGVAGVAVALGHPGGGDRLGEAAAQVQALDQDLKHGGDDGGPARRPDG